MNKHLSKLMLCIALMCFGTINLKAASRYWVASSTSNWNNAANWSATNGGAGGAGVPTSEDDVYFTSSQNGSCNIDVNVDVNHMYSTSSYSGNLNVNTPAGTYSVMVRGNFSKTSGTGTFSLINVSSFTVMGAFSHNYYTFTAPSTTMYLGGAFNQTGGTFNHSNGTIVFNGNSATADMNSFTTVYNLTIAKNNGQTLTINSGDYFAVSNTTNYTDGLCATGSIYAYGDVIVGSGWDGGNASLVITGTANKAIDMTGAADKFAGNIDINKSGSYTTTLSSDVTLKTTNQTLTLTTGTLNLNGKTLTVWNNSTTGTVVGAGGFTISGTGTFNMYNYTQTASGTVALTGASTFRCYNNFSKSISSTAHFNCNAATFIVDGAFTNTAGTFWTSSTTTTIGGNFTHTGGTFSSTAGTVIFNGNSALADMNSFSSIYNLQINKNSGQTLTINTNDYFYVSNVLTLTDGLCSGGRFDAAGNVVVQSGWDGGTSSLTFLASAHTTFDATGAEDKFKGNVDFNKSGASWKVTLQSDWELTGATQALTLTAGTVDLNGKTITLWNGTTNGTLTVAGSFTIEGTGTFNMYKYVHTASGTFSLTGASNFNVYNSFSKTISSSANFSPGSAVVDIDGSFTNTAGTFTTPSSTMYIGGDFTHTGGTFSATSGTVILDGGATTADMNSFSTFFNLIIDKTHGATLTISNGDYFYVQGTLTYRNGLTSGSRIEAAGDVVVESTWDGGNSALHFMGATNKNLDMTGATDKFKGNMDFNKGGSTYIITLLSDVTLSTTGQTITLTVGRINLNGNTLTLWDGGTSGSVTMAGSFTIAGLGTFHMYNFTNNIAASLTISAASTFHCYNALSQTVSGSAVFSPGNATIDVDGNLLVTAGTFTISSGNNYIGGNLTRSGGTLSCPSGTIIMDGTGAQDINVNSSLYNLTIANTSATVTANTNTFNIPSAGTLNILAGATFSSAASIVINSGGNNGTITGYGTIKVTRTSVTADFLNQYKFTTRTITNLTIDYAGGGNQTVNNGIGNYGGLTISGSGTKTLQGNITVNGNLNIGNGTTLSHGSNYTIGFGGNFTNNGTFSQGTAVLTFSGTSAQTISTTQTFDKVKINNSAGIVFDAAVTINGDLDLTNGVVTLGVNNLIMGSLATITGGGSTSFIHTNSTGGLRWLGCASGSKTFPVGHSATASGYVPILLTFNSGAGHTTDNFTLIAIDKATDDATRNGNQYTETCVKTMWSIVEDVSGGSNITMQFQWNTANEGSSFSRSNSHVARYNGSSWDMVGGNAAAAGSNPYTYESANYTSTLGTFGIGSGAGALPVSLISFVGTRSGDDVHLNWATASEHNNDYFTIERSFDGIQFDAVATISGAVNSARILEYMHIDYAVQSSVVYYRLRQTDFNGDNSVSSTIVLEQSATKQIRSIYTSPTSDILNVTYISNSPGVVYVMICGVSGSVSLQKEINLKKGINNLEFITYDLPTGIYILSIGSAVNKETSKFVIQH